MIRKIAIVIMIIILGVLGFYKWIFVPDEFEVACSSGTSCGHDYVDLDLPSGNLWAAYNIGAEKIYDKGDYFAFGETAYLDGKNSFGEDDYVYSCIDSDTTIPLMQRSKGRSLYIYNHGIIYDAANRLWGDAWRVPTSEEWQELCKYCSKEWVRINETTYGYKFTAANGNWLFVPSSGYKVGKKEKYSVNLYYWSSTGFWTGTYTKSKSAEYFYGDKRETDLRDKERYNGLAIRPVLTNPKKHSVTFLSPDGDVYATQDLMEGRSSIKPVEIPEKRGFEFAGWGDKKGNAMEFEKITSDTSVYPIFAKPEYVDLGLSVMWAKSNVGTIKPEGLGDYYAWGEVCTKKEYSQRSYLHFDKENEKYKVLDNNISGNPMYDAARYRWGDGWRMPSVDEWKELQQKCDWKVEKMNSVVGFKVTSRKDENKWIFIPYTGHYADTTLFNLSKMGNYWSSSIYDTSGRVFVFSIQGNSNVHLEGRHYGHTVRAVHPKPSEVFDVTYYNYEGERVATQKVKCGEKPKAVALPDEFCSLSGWVNLPDRVYSDVSVYAYSVDSRGHKFVDLGLPSGMLWSTCNLGAKQPYELGDRYAFGEVKTKNVYDLNTYLHYDKGRSEYRELCKNNPNNRSLAYTKYDVANVRWQGFWYIPGGWEWSELIESCLWKKETVNDVECYRAVSKYNGKSIIFPLEKDSSMTKYWSCNVASNEKYAWGIGFPHDDSRMEGISLYFPYKKHGMVGKHSLDSRTPREYGLYVRPGTYPSCRYEKK